MFSGNKGYIVLISEATAWPGTDPGLPGMCSTGPGRAREASPVSLKPFF